jgi:hypothetical protein
MLNLFLAISVDAIKKIAALDLFPLKSSAEILVDKEGVVYW